MITPSTELRVTPAELDRALVECRQMIRAGSKSFSLAAKIFGAEKRDAAFLLYGWCRYCDDEIDRDDVRPEELAKRLASLKRRTLAAYQGQPPGDAVFTAFQHIVHRYQIPMHYPMELLEGMAMDVRRDRYANFDALTLYCYRVAGTVGLMMSHIMGVSASEALRHASDLGIAMQLTNISRDVLEDAARGRVYLPLDWLAEEGVDPATLSQPSARAGLARVVRRTLKSADSYYRSGERGLKFLSFRSACAVAAASRVYAEIGRRVNRRGERAWETRTWVPPARKLAVMAGGVWRVVRTIPERVWVPWRPAALHVLWRHV